MSTFFLIVVNMSIAASWLVLAVILLRAALRKAPKWMHVLLWGIVAVRLLCPFTIESPLSLLPSKETIPLDIGLDTAPNIDSGIKAINDAVNPIISQSNIPMAGTSVNPMQITMGICAHIWILGMVVMLFYAAISYARLRKSVGASLYLRENIWICDDIQTPFIFGFFNPRVYIPSGTEEAQLFYIVAHENAHLKRRDHWWKPFGYLVLAIHWFNPLVWVAYSLFCRDTELACDEKVIHDLSHSESIEYSETLLSCSTNRRMVMVCPLAFGEVGVKERVKRVLNYKKPAIWLIFVAVIASVILAVCFLTNPIPLGDHFVLTNTDSAAYVHNLSYDVRLGNHIMSGEIYAEQWIDGACVRSSAPVVMSQYADSIDISMRERREKSTMVGTDVQIKINQNTGGLTAHFEHPETHHIVGWSFTGYKLNEKKPLSPNQEVILAAMAFDSGNGVRVVDCETLIAEPERLQNADYMIVIRAVFGSGSLAVQKS